MDFARVQAMLASTYWVPGTTRDAVEHAARNSALLVGAFASDGSQIGYARVVSDKARFAYLCDVVVAEECRGQGVGRAMVKHALEHPDFATVSTWMLTTRDAHGVYAPLGFQPIAAPASRPSDWMIWRRVKPAWSSSAPTEKGAALHNGINLAAKFAQITEHWRPKVAAELNGQELKLVKFIGVFPWHQHEKEDELFLVWRGRMRIEFRDRLVELAEGELCVVPRGVEHRTMAESEAEVLLFEPAGTRNTGNVLDERFTAPNGVRV